MAETIVDITPQNAQQMLLDESFQRPVVADFWADWCEPCKVLTPIMEKLAQEFDGRFLLAKVNADQQQGLAAQLGVRSLPTIIVFVEGQPVDGFSGAQPEGAVRQMLEKYLPKPWDEQLAKARTHLAAGEFSEALVLLRQAATSAPKRADIALALTQALLELKRLDEAEATLDGIPLADHDALYRQLRAELDLRRDAARTPAIQALEARLAEQPDNLDLAYDLAVQLAGEHQHKEALELLYGILRKDREFRDGAARKTLLDSIATLGKGDPLAAEYQRKLFGLMY